MQVMPGVWANGCCWRASLLRMLTHSCIRPSFGCLYTPMRYNITMPPKKEEPRLGIAPERLALSVCLWGIAAAFLYQNLNDSGMIRLLGSHLRAASWNPLAPPCGLLQFKEFVLLADRIVTPRGQVLPGAGESPLGHAAAACAVPSCLLSPW